MGFDISTKIHVIIAGVSGYTGIEAFRLLSCHKNVKIVQVCANKAAGSMLSSVYPHISKGLDMMILSLGDLDFSKCDCVFSCLPHKILHKFVHDIPKNVKIVDISADFRLDDLSLYQKWYCEHMAPELISEAVYGLPELYRNQLKNARIAACAGCYATTAILPLIPLLKDDLIIQKRIIIDAKSGITGGGNTPKKQNHFAELNDNMYPYNVNAHRHIPEIEQELNKVSTQSDVSIEFTPQVIAVNRGILTNIYVELRNLISFEDVYSSLVKFYDNERFVHIKDNAKSVCALRNVVGTNNCDIMPFSGYAKNTVTISCVIDNLIKGGSGQGVQAMNIMFSLPEYTGLEQVAIFP